MRIISIETARRLFILRQCLNDSATAHAAAGILNPENQQDQGQSLILL